MSPIRPLHECCPISVVTGPLHDLCPISAATRPLHDLHPISVATDLYITFALFMLRVGVCLSHTGSMVLKLFVFSGSPPPLLSPANSVVIS